MKTLVTVGTTSFDSLIEYIDTEKFFHEMDIEFQIANGKYAPVRHQYFRFIDSDLITEKYRSADNIITHAGLGTVIQLLEMGKNFIVVPNLERVDKHQTDIADYLTKNKYAFVAYNFNQIGMFIDLCGNYQFNSYSKTPFFKTDEIRSFLAGRSWGGPPPPPARGPGN
jgi:beta-1,4-N-acetylglucosaminyltransferase